MTARLDWSRWGLALTMAGAACAVGLLAGYDPGLAIVASLGIAFVILTVADLTIGLVSFAAISTVDYASSASGSFSVTKLLGLLLAASWLAVITTRPTARTDFIRTHPYLFGLIGLFLTWALVSFVWAEDAGASLASTQRWALNFVLFLIVFTAVRTPQQARWVGYSFLAGAAVVAVIGLANGPDPSGEGRLATAGLDPNELAAILVAGIVLGLGLAAAARGRLATRCATVILVAVCTSTLMLTASRGGLIALTVAMLAGLLMAKHWRIQIALAALAIALTGYYYFATVATPEARERLVSTTAGEQRVLQGRTTIWHVGWRTFEANPVVGVGDGNFGVS